MARVAILFALALSPTSAINTGHQFMEKSEAAGNPIRKVTAMLQNMQKKINDEGQKEKQMFDRFMCYCENSGSSLTGSIASGESKVSELSTSIEAHTAQKAQLEQELQTAKTGRDEANSAISTATSLREKEASSYAQDAATLQSNIDALGGAISAISKGVGGAFLQTSTAATLRKIALAGPSMNDADRQDLMSFLSGEHGNNYVPQSDQITGILKNLKDLMSKNLADVTTNENDAISSHEGLISAKTKQVEALQAAIEAKSKRAGELAVTIAMERNDSDDTSDAVSQDKNFNADLANNCKTKKAEWAEIVATRSAEMVAIADTIKLLSNDEALELFKKSLPASSFIQLATTTDTMRSKALAIINKAHLTGSPTGLALEFVDLALHGKKLGFASVIKMINNMVAQLNVEQANDNNKKEYCETHLEGGDDKRKNLDQKLADLATAMASAEEGIASTRSELEQLDDGIKALDKSVAEATEQRKVENTDHTELMGSDAAAKELLSFARNRLNKFYHTGSYKAAPTQSLVQSAAARDDIDFASGSAPPPPPAAPGAFKKNEESGSVIEMIDLLIKDLDKEMQLAEADEKEAQRIYEQTMRNSAQKRSQDSKLITEKESMKAELESELQDTKAGKLSSTNALMVTLKYIGGLHKECDWLLKNMEVRKAARASEIDSLGNAKATLSGADVSLVQRRSLRAQKQLSPQ